MRLLQIEILKIKRYKAFWIISGVYILLLALMIFGIPGLIDFIADKSNEANNLKLFKSIVFNFPDIWQNISYVAGARYFIKVIIGIIVMIIVTNEYTHRTTRLNIINGLSRDDFLKGKLWFIFMISVASTLVLFLSGLYLGLTQSTLVSFERVFSRMEFLGAYLIELFTFLVFAMLIAVLVRKTGFAIIFLLLYGFVEPILDFRLPDPVSRFLPMNVMNSLVKTPNTSLIKVNTPDFNMDFQEYVSLQETGLCVLYAVIFIVLTRLLLQKRDL